MKTQFVADDGTVFDTEQECRYHELFDQQGFGRFYTATFKLLEDPETAPLYQAWRSDYSDLENIWRHRKILKKMAHLIDEVESK